MARHKSTLSQIWNSHVMLCHRRRSEGNIACAGFDGDFGPATSSFVVSQVNGSNNNQVPGMLDVFVSPQLRFVTHLVMEGKATARRFFQVETASLYLRVKVDGICQCQMRSSKKSLVGPYRGSIAKYGIPYEVCPGFHDIGFVSVWCSVAQRWWLNKQCSSQPKSPCPFQKKPTLSSVFPKEISVGSFIPLFIYRVLDLDVFFSPPQVVRLPSRRLVAKTLSFRATTHSRRPCRRTSWRRETWDDEIWANCSEWWGWRSPQMVVF